MLAGAVPGEKHHGLNAYPSAGRMSAPCKEILHIYIYIYVHIHILLIFYHIMLSYCVHIILHSMPAIMFDSRYFIDSNSQAARPLPLNWPPRPSAFHLPQKLRLPLQARQVPCHESRRELLVDLALRGLLVQLGETQSWQEQCWRDLANTWIFARLV